MSNIVKFRPIPENVAEDERLRELAQRALAPPDFPFDGLNIEAAMILSRLSLAAVLPLSAPDTRTVIDKYGDAA